MMNFLISLAILAALRLCEQFSLQPDQLDDG